MISQSSVLANLFRRAPLSPPSPSRRLPPVRNPACQVSQPSSFVSDALPDLSGWIEDKGGVTVALHTASPIMVFVDGEASSSITKSPAAVTLDPAFWGPALEALDVVCCLLGTLRFLQHILCEASFSLRPTAAVH